MRTDERSTAVQPSDDIFAQIQDENLDLTQAMYATYMLRRFLSLGVKTEYVTFKENFSCLKIHAKEHHYIEVRPVVTVYEGTRTEEPLMKWQAFPDDIKKLLAADHPGGFYYYKARFTLFIDDFDPENPDAEGKVADADGPGEIGTITVNSSDFQEFFFSALYAFAEHHNVEVFPKMRRSRVEL